MANVRLDILLGLVDKAKPGLQSTENQLRELRAEVGKTGKDFKAAWGEVSQMAQRAGYALTAMGTAGVVAFEELGRRAAQFGSEIADMSRRVGTSAEDLTAFKYAADQTGASMQSVEKGLRMVSRAAYEAGRGSAEYVDAFAALGIEVEDLKGKSPAELFTMIGEALRGTEDEALRTALAMKVLGRSGTELLPMFTDGNKSITDFKEEAKRLNLVLSDELVESLDDADDAMARAKSTIGGAATIMGAVAAPVLKSLADAVVWLTVQVGNFAKAHPTLTKFGLLAFAALSALFIPIGGLLIALPSVIQIINFLTAATGHTMLAAIGARIELLATGAAARFAGLQATYASGGFSALATSLLAKAAPLAAVVTVLASLAASIKDINSMVSDGIPLWKALGIQWVENVIPLNALYKALRQIADWLGADVSNTPRNIYGFLTDDDAVRKAFGGGATAPRTERDAALRDMGINPATVNGTTAAATVAPAAIAPTSAMAPAGNTFKVTHEFIGRDVDGKLIAANPDVRAAIVETTQSAMGQIARGLRYSYATRD